MLFIVQTALKLGTIYALVSLALFLSYRILDIADLTTDGGFVLGMAVSVSVAAAGYPVLGLIAAPLAGACAGFVTAFLQTRLGVPSILAGIVTNTGLYTVNLMVMGWSSNISLLKQATIFTRFKATGIGGSWYELIITGGITAAAMLLMHLFLKTRLGLSIRATGDNRDMVRASSINPVFTITTGLCISNALTSLAGGVIGQMQKSADINGGTGIVVVGLACLIIGETFVGRRTMARNILAVLVGSILYRLLYAVILKTALVPIECLKLMTAVIVGLAIATPTLKAAAAFQKKKLAGSKH